MPAHTMTTRARVSDCAIGQQAVNSRDSDVVKMLNVIAHHFGGDHGFFRHWNIAGSGRDYSDDSLAIFLLVALQNNRPCQSADTRPSELSSLPPQTVRALPAWPGCCLRALPGEKRWTPFAPESSRPEDHFRHSVTQGAMVIHFGESEIFKREMPQAIDCVIRRKFSRAHLLEKFADGIGVQGSTQRRSAFANASLD